MADQNERDIASMSGGRFGSASETGWAGGWEVKAVQSAPTRRTDAIVPKASEGDGISFAVIVPDGVELEYTITFYRRVGEAWVPCTVWADLAASKIVSRRRAGDQVAFKITAITVTVGDLDDDPLTCFYKTTSEVISDA